MLLVLHIITALASLIFSSALFITPSKFKLRASYALTAFTLASGTFLVVSSGAQLAGACTTGLLYLGLVSVGIIRGQYKLAHTTVRR